MPTVQDSKMQVDPGRDSSRGHDSRSFTEYLETRPGFGEHLRSRDRAGRREENVRIRGRLLNSETPGRFIIHVVDRNRAFEGLTADVLSRSPAQGADAEMSEIVMPADAVVREIRLFDALEVAEMTWARIIWDQPGYAHHPGYGYGYGYAGMYDPIAWDHPGRRTYGGRWDQQAHWGHHPAGPWDHPGRRSHHPMFETDLGHPGVRPGPWGHPAERWGHPAENWDHPSRWVTHPMFDHPANGGYRPGGFGDHHMRWGRRPVGSWDNHAEGFRQPDYAY